MATATISNRVVIERNIMVPMRDGVRLATDIYRPDKPGRFPVLLQRLPYGKNILERVFLDPTQTAQRDYVVVAQDSRGRFDSEPVIPRPEPARWAEEEQGARRQSRRR